jgi:hypothetical protein
MPEDTDAGPMLFKDVTEAELHERLARPRRHAVSGRAAASGANAACGEQPGTTAFLLRQIPSSP